MKNLGDKINEFENLPVQNVRAFNSIFENPLTGYDYDDIVEIGDILSGTTTRQILINNIAKEHCFERRTRSENDYEISDDDTIDDDDWLYYFV